MNERKTLDFSSLPAVIQGMIEENSNAASIIDELIEKKGEKNTVASLIILDDMNIRGIQISNLYKMCNQDINLFYEKILSMTKEDIEKLNLSTYAICKFKAILNGDKKDRLKNPDKYIFTDEERNNIRNKKNKNLVHDILDNPLSKKISERLTKIVS